MKVNEDFETSREGFDEYIDLTYSLSPESPVWPGEQKARFKEISTLPRDSANVSRVDLNVHTETHVDAPGHFIEDGATIDQLPLETFSGKAVFYSSSEKPRGQEIELEKVKRSVSRLSEGDIFILDSGLRVLRGSNRYYEDFPVPSNDLLEWLSDQGVKLFCTDCPSIDPLGSQTHEKHKLLLSDGIPVVENLANLNLLKAGEDIIFFSFPLKLKGLEASPCRAVALVK